MCTPVGHSLVGYTILLSRHDKNGRGWWMVVFSAMVISNLPDVDFLFGYIVGHPNQYHHLWTHSLVFALLAGLFFGFGYRVFKRRAGIRVGFLVFAVILSHVVLDLFTKDTSPPYGMQLFWPVSRGFFISPVTIFREVSKSSASGTFLKSLFCWHNLWTVLSEVGLLGIPLGFVLFRRREGKNGVLEG